jgi:hypothetical protein
MVRLRASDRLTLNPFTPAVFEEIRANFLMRLWGRVWLGGRTWYVTSYGLIGRGLFFDDALGKRV